MCCDCCEFDDCCDIFVKYIEAVIIVVLIVIGAPLLAVADKTKTKKMWDTVLSLPLLTNNTFPIDEYYITQQNEDVFLNSIDIKVPADYDDIINKDIYIFHNMWGFDIKASLIVNDEIVTTVHKTQNLNFSEPDTPLERYSIQDMPEIGPSLKKNRFYQNYYKVYCPYQTTITEINNVQSFCELKSSPMKFDGKYSSNMLFSSFDSKYFSDITFRFYDSYLIPYSYNDPPEAYILFCGGKFKKAMYKAGLAIVIIACILFVIFIILDIILLCLYII